jgi:hypothetical protein
VLLQYNDGRGSRSRARISWLRLHRVLRMHASYTSSLSLRHTSLLSPEGHILAVAQGRMHCRMHYDAPLWPLCHQRCIH